MSDIRHNRGAWSPSVFAYGIILLGMYTNVGFPVSGRYVAGLLTMAGFVVIILASDLKSFLRASIVGACTLGFLIANVVFTQKVGMPVSERVLSVGLLTVSVTGFSVIVERLSRANDVELSKLQSTFRLICILIIIGCILEAFGVLKPISDYVRGIIYGNSFIYDSSARDIKDFGIVRPKLFTQEPSHVAKMLGLAVFANYALWPSRRNFVVSMLFFAASLFALRSFSVFPSVVLLVILAAVHEGRVYRHAPAIAGVASMATLFAAWNFTALFSLIPNVRAARIAALQDGSAIERFIAPREIAIYALEKFPIFGLGVGAKEYYLPVTVDIYSKFSFYNLYRYSSQADVSFGWYSAFFEGVANFGVLGFVAILTLAVRLVGVRAVPYFFICFLFVFLLDSGFPAPRTWGYFAFYLGILLISLSRWRGGHLSPSPNEGRG